MYSSSKLQVQNTSENQSMSMDTPSSVALKLQIRKSVLLLDFKSNLRMNFNLGFILAKNAIFLRADPSFVLQIYRLMSDVNCLHFNIRKT